MSKFKISVVAAATALCLSSCGTSGSNAAVGSLLGSVAEAAGASNTTTQLAETGTSLLSNLLSGLLSSSQTLSQDAIVGTWKYQQPDCVFESKNLLLKAGGEVAAQKMETQMAQALGRVGIKSGSCSFTFNKDNTYTATIGARKISGNYKLNAKDKTITMTYLGGLGTMTPHVALNGGKLCLLYESDKLLKLVSTVSALSGSTALKTLSSLAGSYDGMYVGMQLKK